MSVITNIGRLFTSTDRGVIDDAAVVVEAGAITWVGRGSDAPRVEDEVVDAEGALMTPGLVDAHTHPVYAGNRFGEIALRSSGASYADIAAAGGGIGATVDATRSADDLESVVAARLRSWLAAGTTTVEAKTGYHLTESGELGAVALLAALGRRGDLPRVAVTFLGAHAVPAGFERADDYVDEVVRWTPAAAASGAHFTDVFCDEGYFTAAQSRTVLDAGRAAGLDIRIHADELVRTGGAILAAELGAASADHLLQIDHTDVKALAAAGVVATLAPITAMAMKKMPPVRQMIDAGVTIALGTDHNPGTSGSTDMTVAIAAAVAAFGISVADALRAATAGGAASLRRSDVGVVQEGARADLVLWDADHEGAFAWSWGLKPLKVWRGGSLVA
ncbi:MAG: imidazolonepropionase [Actinobacteria bacterium]|nr:imidazolonepropionase [Actinomycetota bacterium]